MSTASAAKQKYADLQKKIADARKQMEETAKTLFSEMSAELFAENPTLVSFGWTQYTPYFNDGDVCEFSAHTSYPTVAITIEGDVYSYDSNRGEMLINGEEVTSADELVRQFKSMGVDSFSKGGKLYAYDGKTVTVDGNKIPTYSENSKLFDPLEKVVAEFLNAFEDEDLKTMFGDHVQVTINRDSVNVEHHEHD